MYVLKILILYFFFQFWFFNVDIVVIINVEFFKGVVKIGIYFISNKGKYYM